MRFLIYSAILIRIATQLSCDFITNPIAEGLVYAIGVAYFELVSLYVFTKVLSKDDFIVNFALGLCVFDLFKFIFLEPFKINYFDYMNLVMGAIFLAVVYYRSKNKKEDIYTGKL